MESAASSLPQQQQGGQIGTTTSTSSGSVSSGSIGPFFAVISVLAVISIISCVVGRICSRRRGAVVTLTPLDRIKHGGYFGWLKRKCSQCMAGDVEVGAKVMAFGDERDDAKPKDIADHNEAVRAQQPPRDQA